MKLEELINQYYDTLTANDRYICECILHNRQDCIRLSIDEFAYKFHISTSTLSRFAQKLQLPGYSELRVILKMQTQEQGVHMHSQSIDQMLDGYKKDISYIKEKDCSIMFERMKRANRIFIFGEGYAQGRIGKEMKRIFLPTGKKFYDVYGKDAMGALEACILPNDVIFFISFQGTSPDLITFATNMKMKGIYSISITKMISNSLSQICSDNLYINAMDLHLDHVVTYEVSTPYFILIELLYIKYKLYWIE